MLLSLKNSWFKKVRHIYYSLHRVFIFTAWSIGPSLYIRAQNLHVLGLHTCLLYMTDNVGLQSAMLAPELIFIYGS
jgi:hypothetical protein